MVAYYQSDFSVPVPQQEELDRAIGSLDSSTESLKGAKGRKLGRHDNGLDTNVVVSGLSSDEWQNAGFGCSGRLSPDQLFNPTLVFRQMTC